MSLASFFVLKGYNYDLRNIFNLIFEGSIKTKLYVKRLVDNIKFNEKYTDFLLTCTEEDLVNLKDYKETTYEDYLKEYYNSIFENKIVKESSVKKFSKDFMITNNDGITITINHNNILILDIETKRIIFNIQYNYEIIDFKIDEEGFVYIFYKKDNKERLIKTHINFNFFLDNKNHYNHINKFEEIDKLYDIEIIDYSKLLYTENEYIYYLDKTNNIRRIELCRKYYFYKDGKIFYNSFDKKSEAIQIEHLHLYDYISVLGLNEFKYDDFKISSFDLNYLNEILLFKFDSSLNGTINYFDFGKPYKSYKVNKDISFIKILGNFNYNYQKGKYTIKIFATKTSSTIETKVTLELIKDGECLKSITCNTCDNIIYFCNLKFIFYADSYNKINTKIKINVIDDYPVKIKRNIKYIDENTNHNDLEKIFKMQQVLFKEGKDKKQLVEIDYKNGELIVKDYIKDNNGRYFGKDYKLRIVEEDGLPSLLWRKIEDKDYYFCFRHHVVKKIIKPRSKTKFILNTKKNKFRLLLNEYFKMEE